MLALLALETGQIFYGRSIGVTGIKVGEVVFNTALTGYQETLTDPSYTQQIITFTYPHIGNTGINTEDHQSQKIWAAGVIVKSLSKFVSNWRAKMSLNEFLQSQQIVGIEGVDTRGLTRILRDKGSLRGCVMSGITDENYAIAQARSYKGLQNQDLTMQVTTKDKYILPAKKNVEALNVVVMDFGAKHSILECLQQRNCNIIVVPANTGAEKIKSLAPDAVLLSNGPGDPGACRGIITEIQRLLSSDIPIFGICLGYQLLALALGAKTYKMGFGHHGCNHPVYSQRLHKVLITSQNHGFAVDELSLPPDLEVTHRSLFDGTLQGFKHKSLPIFGFQGHPEAGPGPHDAKALFDDFLYAVRKSHAKAFEFA